jgi:aminoglycoside phosphotransferase (APT) family kinase protein
MSGEQWHADIEVTETVVKACVQDQFPVLSPIQSIRCIGEGWDNKVFLVNEKIIFRFPRRKIAIELIERENDLLKSLQSMFSLDIPNPQYIGKPTEDYPYPFQGYPMIKGISGCHANLKVQDRITSLPTLAAFLKQLHSIDEQKAFAIGAKPQILERINVKKMVNALNERVEKIIDRKLCRINKVVFQEEITTVQKINLPSHEKCLIHGDLYCRHLFFNDGKLTGIIDWGDAGINNKSVDLSVIWSFYPSTCHSLFFELYGAVDLATWRYARFLALYSMFTTLLYGHDIGDDLLATESRDSIKRINADLFAD